MQEISNTITETNAKAGEPVVFEVEDVETSTDTTIDLDDEVSDQEGCAQQVLHIDLSGKHEEILLDEEVSMVTPTENDPNNMLDQHTESED